MGKQKVRLAKTRAAEGIEERHNADGSVSYLARVKVAGFSIPVQAFRSGTEQFKSTKVALEAAKAWRAERRRQFLEYKGRNAVSGNVAKLTVSTLIGLFLADEKTQQRKYYADLQLLLSWWQKQIGPMRCLDEFNPLVLQEKRTQLRRSVSASTANRYLSALRRAWNWGREGRYIPVDRLWPPGLMLQEAKGRIRFLSDEEIDSLLNVAAEVDPVIHAAIVVSIATGLRQGELLRLRWEDLRLTDETHSTATVHLSKTGRRRTVHLTAGAVEALRALKKLPIVSPAQVFVHQHDGQSVTKGSLQHPWERVRARAGLEDFRWHDLRHTFASIQIQNGATLVQVGEALGHSSPVMTARYSHMVQGAPIPGHAALDAKLRAGRKPA